MDQKLAEQVVRLTADWLEEKTTQLIRACVDSRERRKVNILLLADDLSLQAESLRKVQEFLRREG